MVAISRVRESVVNNYTHRREWRERNLSRCGIAFCHEYSPKVRNREHVHSCVHRQYTRKQNFDKLTHYTRTAYYVFQLNRRRLERTLISQLWLKLLEAYRHCANDNGISNTRRLAYLSTILFSKIFTLNYSFTGYEQCWRLTHFQMWEMNQKFILRGGQ